MIAAREEKNWEWKFFESIKSRRILKACGMRRESETRISNHHRRRLRRRKLCKTLTHNFFLFLCGYKENFLYIIFLFLFFFFLYFIINENQLIFKIRCMQNALDGSLRVFCCVKEENKKKFFFVFCLLFDIRYSMHANLLWRGLFISFFFIWFVDWDENYFFLTTGAINDDR